MKYIFAFLMIAMGATVTADEIKRVDGRDYSCPELQKMVQEEGRLYIYGWWWGGAVYVSSRSYCGSQAKPSAAPSSDKSLCTAGKRCVFQPNNK
jgi:hypothetical protein